MHILAIHFILIYIVHFVFIGEPWLNSFVQFCLHADDFKDILAGQEYAQILATMSTHLGTLRIINNLQKEYLDATKSYKETAPAARNKKLMIQIRQKWFDDVSNLSYRKC